MIFFFMLLDVRLMLAVYGEDQKYNNFDNNHYASLNRNGWNDVMLLLSSVSAPLLRTGSYTETETVMLAHCVFPTLT
jgi:hypothetical protein